MTSSEAFWWRADALCPEVGPDLFFLPRGNNAKEAKRVCQMCPVRAECLAESLIYEDNYGIFGGFGRDVRLRLAARLTPETNPMAIAVAAITKENQREQRRTTDHRPPVPRRGRGDQLHPRAG